MYICKSEYQTLFFMMNTLKCFVTHSGVTIGHRSLLLIPNWLITLHYIYIYAFSRRFYPKRLTLHSSYSFTFDQLLLSLGIEPMILVLLTPCFTIWATGKINSHFLKQANENKLKQSISVRQPPLTFHSQKTNKTINENRSYLNPQLRTTNPTMSCDKHSALKVRQYTA